MFSLKMEKKPKCSQSKEILISVIKLNSDLFLFLPNAYLLLC